MKIVILVLAFLLLAATQVSAVEQSVVEYPSEYYALGVTTDTPWQKISGAYYGFGQEFPSVEYLTFLELRRHTILLEKQNELLAEQNALLRNLTERKNVTF